MLRRWNNYDNPATIKPQAVVNVDSMRQVLTYVTIRTVFSLNVTMTEGGLNFHFRATDFNARPENEEVEYDGHGSLNLLVFMLLLLRRLGNMRKNLP